MISSLRSLDLYEAGSIKTSKLKISSLSFTNCRDTHGLVVCLLLMLFSVIVWSWDNFWLIVGKNVFPQVRFVRGKTNLPWVHVRRIRPLREGEPYRRSFPRYLLSMGDPRRSLFSCLLSRGDLSRICSLWSWGRMFSPGSFLIVLHKRSIFFVRLTLI